MPRLLLFDIDGTIVDNDGTTRRRRRTSRISASSRPRRTFRPRSTSDRPRKPDSVASSNSAKTNPGDIFRESIGGMGPSSNSDLMNLSNNTAAFIASTSARDSPEPEEE